MKKTIILVSLLLSIQAAEPTKIKQESTESINVDNKFSPIMEYCNSRFEFCINYDKDFGIEPASKNGDGRVFYDSDGYKMYVFGTYNTLDESLHKEIKFRSENVDVTYKKTTQKWAIVSGYENDKIRYIKIFKVGNVFKVLDIEYPLELKEKYNVLVQKIVKSFRPNTKNNY